MRAEAFTHRHLDYVIGPMRRNDEVYIHNALRQWAIWDHFIPFRENRRTSCQSLSDKENLDWMEAENRRAINKRSDEKRRRQGRTSLDGSEEYFECSQEDTTPNECTEGKRNDENPRECVKKRPQGVRQKSRGECSGDRPGKPELNTW